jgi:hypothetical protein
MVRLLADTEDTEVVVVTASGSTVIHRAEVGPPRITFPVSDISAGQSVPQVANAIGDIGVKYPSGPPLSPMVVFPRRRY